MTDYSNYPKKPSEINSREKTSNQFKKICQGLVGLATTIIMASNFAPKALANQSPELKANETQITQVIPDTPKDNNQEFDWNNMTTSEEESTTNTKVQNLQRLQELRAASVLNTPEKTIEQAAQVTENIQKQENEILTLAEDLAKAAEAAEIKGDYVTGEVPTITENALTITNPNLQAKEVTENTNLGNTQNVSQQNLEQATQITEGDNPKTEQTSGQTTPEANELKQKPAQALINVTTLPKNSSENATTSAQQKIIEALDKLKQASKTSKNLQKAETAKVNPASASQNPESAVVDTSTQTDVDSWNRNQLQKVDLAKISPQTAATYTNWTNFNAGSSVGNFNPSLRFRASANFDLDNQISGSVTVPTERQHLSQGFIQAKDENDEIIRDDKNRPLELLKIQADTGHVQFSWGNLGIRNQTQTTLTAITPEIENIYGNYQSFLVRGYAVGNEQNPDAIVSGIPTGYFDKYTSQNQSTDNPFRGANIPLSFLQSGTVGSPASQADIDRIKQPGPDIAIRPDGVAIAGNDASLLLAAGGAGLPTGDTQASLRTTQSYSEILSLVNSNTNIYVNDKAAETTWGGNGLHLVFDKNILANSVWQGLGFLFTAPEPSLTPTARENIPLNRLSGSREGARNSLYKPSLVVGERGNAIANHNLTTKPGEDQTSANALSMGIGLSPVVNTTTTNTLSFTPTGPLGPVEILGGGEGGAGDTNFRSQVALNMNGRILNLDSFGNPANYYGEGYVVRRQQPRNKTETSTETSEFRLTPEAYISYNPFTRNLAAGPSDTNGNKNYVNNYFTVTGRVQPLQSNFILGMNGRTGRDVILDFGAQVATNPSQTTPTQLGAGISSPIYFGRRSSSLTPYVNGLYQLANGTDTPLRYAEVGSFLKVDNFNAGVGYRFGNTSSGLQTSLGYSTGDFGISVIPFSIGTDSNGLQTVTQSINLNYKSGTDTTFGAYVERTNRQLGQNTNEQTDTRFGVRVRVGN